MPRERVIVVAAFDFGEFLAGIPSFAKVFMQVAREYTTGSVPPNRTVPIYHDGFAHFDWDQA